MLSFEGGTAYAESDADDEYERSVGAISEVGDSEASPIDSDPSTSTEHTPTTYAHRSTGDRLPETIITEWTVGECADFIGTIGLQQYSDRFMGKLLRHRDVRKNAMESATSTDKLGRKRNRWRGIGSIIT